MPGKIGFTANGMFPVAALPYSFFTFRSFARCPRQRRLPARKGAFDQTPSARIVAVAVGQSPNGVQMIRQDADRNGFKRPALCDVCIDRTQPIDLRDQEIASSVGKRYRKKECTARHLGTPVVWHGRMLAQQIVVGTAHARLCPPYALGSTDGEALTLPRRRSAARGRLRSWRRRSPPGCGSRRRAFAGSPRRAPSRSLRRRRAGRRSAC